jgi:hypothetical protein
MGLICDLSGVDHLDPVCATVFATVVNHPSTRWPTTGFAFCGAQPPVAEILGRLQVPDFLPVYASVEEALDAVVVRPPYLRDELVLAPTPTAPAAARAFSRQVCRDWELALPGQHPGRAGGAVGQRAGHQRRGPYPHRAAVAAGAARRPPPHRRP